MLISLCLFIVNSTNSPSSFCHDQTWMYLDSNTNQCVCGDSLGGSVVCDAKASNVYITEKYYCMFFSEELNTTLIGNCPYNYGRSHNIFLPVPKDQSKVKKGIGLCASPLHRKGLLCGQCEDNYTLPVYSYNLACVKCEDVDYKYGWIKFIAVAFLPLTVFYMIVIIFRISATSSTLNGYILVSQLLSTPTILYTAYTINTAGTFINNYVSQFFVRLGISFYAIWNLDIFRAFYNPICLHPHITYQHVLMLDYGIAVYPLFLILITFIFVKLHDNFAIVAWIWRPFHKCLFLFRKHWNIQSYLVNALTTFIVLSYVKILNISFQFLTRTHVYNVFNKRVNKAYYWYYDGSMDMTSREYLPYFLVATFMLLMFNVVPLMLLALYPFKCFQSLLSYCCCTRCKLSLQIYMDAFHGCYENQTHDYRHFATIYLAIRFINVMLLSIFHYHQYFILAIFPFLVTLALVATFRPYKIKRSNTIDTVLLLAFIITCSCYYTGRSSIDDFAFSFPIRKFMLCTSILIPPGYFLCLVSAKVVPRILTCVSKIKSYFRRCHNLNIQLNDENQRFCDHNVANYNSCN